MTRLSICIGIAAVLFAANAGADEAALRRQLSGQDGWVGYNVPIVAGAGSPCCYSGSKGSDFQKAGCDLDERKGGFVSNRASPVAASELSVYWHVADGKADQVRAFAADCPVTSQQQVRWIESVGQRDSIAALADWIGHADARHDDDSSGLVAIALHADPLATTTLIGYAGTTGNSNLRENAIFWLGLARGGEGADYVQKLATTDPNREVREHAVFALSQSREKDAYGRVRAIARQDAVAEVRGKALFWMAQMDDPRAKADILAALDGEKSEDALEEAVFALSQLNENVATSALIAVIRGNYSRPVKEKALFWLGQAGTEEAMAFLDSVLTK